MTIWDSAHGRDDRVIDKGGWGDLYGYLDRIPERCGVFVFANVDLQIKYIGWAGAGELQSAAKLAVENDLDFGATRVNYYVTSTTHDAEQLAEDWIEIYEPINNG